MRVGLDLFIQFTPFDEMGIQVEHVDIFLARTDCGCLGIVLYKTNIYCSTPAFSKRLSPRRPSLLGINYGHDRSVISQCRNHSK